MLNYGNNVHNALTTPPESGQIRDYSWKDFVALLGGENSPTFYAHKRPNLTFADTLVAWRSFFLFRLFLDRIQTYRHSTLWFAQMADMDDKFLISFQLEIHCDGSFTVTALIELYPFISAS